MRNQKVTFKTYSLDQQQLLPPSLEELLPQNHLARIVNTTIDQLNTQKLIAAYPGGGASSYHPVMMFKIIVYAYSQKIYSSRKIAKALDENIPFMWLSGGNTPDFRTINRFRCGPLKKTLRGLFTCMTEHLITQGHVSLKNYFLDGTKIEADANKYTWVWRKATEKFSRRLSDQIDELWKYIDQMNQEEDQVYGDRGLDEDLPKGKSYKKIVDELAEKFNEVLEKQPLNKELNKIKKKIDKDYKPRSQKYDDQLTLFKGRNSYSKTDTDATFMRMKEDAMRNGQLKPGYNVQIGTENQFILGYSLHPNPCDSPTFIPHMKKLKEEMGKYPQRVIADSGYGCDKNHIEKYIKFSMFHKEQKRKYKNNRFNKDNWSYDSAKDIYTCPQEKLFSFSYERQTKTSTGFCSKEKVYEGPGCSECPLKTGCTTSQYDRKIHRKNNWENHKEEVRGLLKSEEGLRMRSLRPIEPETVFGQVKKNMGFKRFHLRGQKNVETEWGLICMAHNIMKLAARS